MMRSWREPADAAAGAPDWAAVALFMLVALGWSAAANGIAALQLPAAVGGFRIDNSLLVGFGPALGAVAARLWRRPAGAVPGFAGWRPAWIALALAAPVLTLAIWGFGRSGGADRHLAGAMFAASVLIYCVGEELGWRGYLFAALAGLPLWQSAAITAVLWYGWHWTFLADTLADPRAGPVFAAAVVLASFGLARAVRRTRAVGMAVAWHAAAKTMGAPGQIVAMLALIATTNWAAGRGGADRRP